jgi:hypothetical protein
MPTVSRATATPPAAISADSRNVIVAVETATDPILVRWSDGHESRFHRIWLRHGCFCPTTRGDDGALTNIRLPDRRQAIAGARISVGNGGFLQVDWPDGQSSEFPGWLRAHCYSRKERESRRRRAIPRGAAAGSELPRFAYPRLAADRGYQLASFEAILDYGSAFVTELPPQEGQIRQVAELFGLIHPTNYGEIVDIKVDLKLAINTALNRARSPHTDESHRQYPCGLIFMHCLRADAAGGGESAFVDGLAVAERLRSAAPEAFEILSRSRSPSATASPAPDTSCADSVPSSSST